MSTVNSSIQIIPNIPEKDVYRVVDMAIDVIRKLWGNNRGKS